MPMERQNARWRHAGCANVRDFKDWVLQMTLKKIVTFYVTSRLHEKFSHVTIFICHIKTGANLVPRAVSLALGTRLKRARQSSTRANKNCHIKIARVAGALVTLRPFEAPGRE